MFYLVCGTYAPNTAPTNRIMAYVRALSEYKVETRVVFFFPNRAHSRVQESYPNIEFEYLWQRGYINLPRINKISLKFYLKRFIKNLKQGDKVYVYAFPDLVVELAKKRDINVFVERTEYDGVSFACHVQKTTVPKFLDACRVIDGVIVISQNLKQYYIEQGCNPDRVHIVNMIADPSRFYGVDKQFKEPYIAYCGTATNTKDGVDELIKAFALTVSHHPEFKLYIIGSTPSKKQRYENFELAKKLGVDSKVVFTGVVPSAEMPQMLKNASILALDRPNNLQAQYGFPTKLGEYLLTANPVVITSIGNIPLFLKDMESALIAEPQNPQAFAEKLNWAIEHPDEAQAIGQKGKRIAEESFNSTIETKKIIDIVFNDKQNVRYI